jgi:hypothetical protein
MRMMTGSILILASVVLFAVYKFDDLRPMYEWYSFGMGLIGWAFLFWGLVKDLRAGHRHGLRRQKNPEIPHKGDT